MVFQSQYDQNFIYTISFLSKSKLYVFYKRVFMSTQTKTRYKTIEREENPLLKELNSVLGILLELLTL